MPLSLQKVFVCGSTVALLAFLTSAAAQVPQNSPPPPPASILLPHKVVAGGRATLAVLDASGHLVAGAAVELSGFGEVKTDSAGRATFVAPAGSNSLYAEFKGGGAPTIAPIVSADAPAAATSGTVAQIHVPSAIALGEPFEIDGSGFGGDALQDRVLIGDQPALVLAASPLSIVALPNPNAATGDSRLSLIVQGKQIGAWPVTVISLDLAGPASSLKPGATSAFEVRVSGSTKPVLVQATNATPDVVRLPGGNVRRLVTSGGASNTVALPVVSIRPGDYSVSVRLLPVVPGAPDLETARLELTDARGAADSKWQKRLDGILALMKRSPSDVARIRQEMLKQMKEHPPAQIEDSLRVSLQLLAAN